MKIIFLCGCLEPGRDGVGDYTRRLAGECVRQGCSVKMVALNERGLEESLVKNWQTELEQDDCGTLVPSWRWPEQISWQERGNELVELIKREGPDVISLQFVPYSFHLKGLPFNCVQMIHRVAGKATVRWQVMFHELWLTKDLAHSFPKKLVGVAQKMLIFRLLSSLRPQTVFTNTMLHCERLRTLGFGAQLLPLFGNIPRFCEVSPPPEIADVLKSHFLVLYFGSLPAEPDFVGNMLRMLSRRESKVPVLFISVGISGPHYEANRKMAESILGKDNVRFVGPKGPAELSAFMEFSHLAISRYTSQTFEKSGALASMAEHGMKILLRDEKLPRETVPFKTLAETATEIINNANA